MTTNESTAVARETWGEPVLPPDPLRQAILGAHSDVPTVFPSVITDTMRNLIRVPYAMRRVPASSLAHVMAYADSPQSGDIVLARLKKVGKNTRIELANGRACGLHVGDLLAVVFGNRYATMQFEGYARRRGDDCDLMSMGGLCGMVESKHDNIADSTQLQLLGALCDSSKRPLHLRDFSLPKPEHDNRSIGVVVVCGTSMDAGKTYTAASLIQGFRSLNIPTAAIKLTGTAAGRDTWSMLDAGACLALDFIDGGLPSTYKATLDDLLELNHTLLGHAAASGAQWAVVEIADGLLQSETAALLQCKAFTRQVDAWVFAAGEPLSAVAGVQLLNNWGLRPNAVSGRVTMSQLAIREAETATGIACLTAKTLQNGGLAAQLVASCSPERRDLSRNSAVVPSKTP